MLISVYFLVKPSANPFYMIPEPGQRKPFSSNNDQPCKIDWYKSCSLWYPPGPQTVIMLLSSEQGVLHFLFLKLRFKLACSQIWGPIVSCQLRWHSGSPIDPSPHYCQQGKATKIVTWCLIEIWHWHGIFFATTTLFAGSKAHHKPIHIKPVKSGSALKLRDSFFIMTALDRDDKKVRKSGRRGEKWIAWGS